jgi:hypothetical protein
MRVLALPEKSAFIVLFFHLLNEIENAVEVDASW